MRLIIGVIFIFLAFTFGLESGVGYFIVYLCIGVPLLLSGGEKQHNKNIIMSERREKEGKIRKMVTSSTTSEFVEKIISEKIKQVKIFNTCIEFDDQEITYNSLNLPNLDDIELEGLAAGIKGKLEYQLDDYYIEKRGIYRHKNSTFSWWAPDYHYDDVMEELIGYTITLSKKNYSNNKKVDKKPITGSW